MKPQGRKRAPLVADKRHSSPKKKKTATRKPAKPRKPAKRTRRGPVAFVLRIVGWVFRVIWRLSAATALIIGLMVGLGTAYYYSTLPPAAELLDARARGSVTLKDRDGEVFAWRGEQYGGAITTDTVSPFLKDAVIATEDKRFYRHFGVSPRGVASAIKINLSEGRGPLSGHGGSTITQQTAKLLCIGVPYDPTSGQSEREYEAQCREGSLWRKVKEAVYALAMEAKYTKDDILTIYLNRAFLGAGARGFEAASQRYFSKHASSLSASEAAMLAGLLKAPSYYAPTRDLKRAQDRANLILGLMNEQGYLSNTDTRLAKANPATLSEAAGARRGGYFADWVMESGPDFLTRDTTEDVIIRTTFDARIQNAAEAAMKTIFETKVREGSKAQAAIVVMSADGAVRAMVGGRDTKVSGAFNRATHAKRQTGSAFKPFVYAAALDLGWTPNDLIDDTPLTIDIPGSGPWSPRNYDKKFHGPVTLTEALAKSLNIPAVRLSETVGRDAVRSVAEQFGIKSDLALGPALALGASEASLIEMVGAYAGILNGGSSVRPYGLSELRLSGDDTPLMGQDGGMGERVISQQAAQYLTYMMSKVVERGTGARAALPDRPVAAKTGTTQAARDAWFLGFTGDYVAGVWMGYDDNTPLSGVTGGGLPAEIWRETMLRVHEGMPSTPLPMAIPPEVQPEPDQSAQGRKRRGNGPSAEDVILDVLTKILTGN
ncbi:MAG: transglycosylase domain-containing protein [Brevirhabdus sp.]